MSADLQYITLADAKAVIAAYNVDAPPAAGTKSADDVLGERLIAAARFIDGLPWWNDPDPDKVSADEWETHLATLAGNYTRYTLAPRPPQGPYIADAVPQPIRAASALIAADMEHADPDIGPQRELASVRAGEVEAEWEDSGVTSAITPQHSDDELAAIRYGIPSVAAYKLLKPWLQPLDATQELNTGSAGASVSVTRVGRTRLNQVGVGGQYP